MCGTRLRAVDQDDRAGRVRARNDLLERRDRSERVADVRERDELAAVAAARSRSSSTSSPSSSTGMKRSSAPVLAASSCHGTRFEWCSSSRRQDRVAGLEVLRSPSEYATRLIASVVLRVQMISADRRVDEARDLRARVFERVGRAFGDLVDAAMDVGVVARVVVDQRVDDGLRLLRGRRRVEVDEAFAARGRLREDREVGRDARGFAGRFPGAIVAGSLPALLRARRADPRAVFAVGKRASAGSKNAERDHALGLVARDAAALDVEDRVLRRSRRRSRRETP